MDGSTPVQPFINSKTLQDVCTLRKLKEGEIDDTQYCGISGAMFLSEHIELK